MDLGNIEFIGTREKFLDSVLLQDQLIHGLGKNYLAFSNLRTRGAEVIWKLEWYKIQKRTGVFDLFGTSKNELSNQLWENRWNM